LLKNKFPSIADSWIEKFGSSILAITDYRGDLCVQIDPKSLREMVKFLKDNSTMPFSMMMDIFGMDYLKYEPEQPERFAVIYNLYSILHHRRVFLKAYLPENNPEIDSLHDIFKMANWFEREAWDLFGIVFKGHPFLVRILCHQDFVGHPLRKDYPSDQYQRLKTAAPESGF